MSSDAIIAGLKQGNAMEMATIDEVKAGMNSVLDGMLRECFNRSDGLTELTENLQLESSSAAARTMTAEQKTRLTKVIENAIRDCEKAIINNDSKRANECKARAATFKAESDMLNMMRTTGLAQQSLFKRYKNMFDDKHGDIDAAELNEIKKEWRDVIEKLRTFHSCEREGFLDRRSRRIEEIENTHKTSQDALKKQIESLKRIATIAKLDLKATSRDEASDHVSIQEPQAAHISIASSPVGRGGRGSFSSRGSVHGLSGPGMLGARGGRGSFQSRPTDPFPSIPDSQTLTVDYLRSLGR
ncbi:hypothetical protein J4E80_008971 [Alternaria sp. BMP 0032]|nr:hypothetical protein J4E80_008971 [Alternaria sp. BMP 0032]